jgi:hypothetical protein
MTFSQIEQTWIKAGGNPALAPTMAAIAEAESSGRPGVVQSGQPYSTTGWGLWQITPGNSVPSAGTNSALLNPITNAKAAIAKLNSQGLRAWTTYNDGAYRKYMPPGATTPAFRSGGTPSTATLSASKTTSTSSCLLSIPFKGCILTKAEGKQIVGFLVVTAGGGVIVVGLLMMTAYGLGGSLAKQVLNRVGGVKAPTKAPATKAPATKAPAKAPTKAPATKAPATKAPAKAQPAAA